ncbi:MAG: cold shock domain-containing protein, partial [Candidatus Devosia euplotis]|nr:cold shock domain-containing protein [Candidatus Devosia euplotis]
MAGADASGDSGEAGLDTIEISGAIKWFDAGKGFGFIVPDNGMPD